jgi:hypothetical protein
MVQIELKSLSVSELETLAEEIKTELASRSNALPIEHMSKLTSRERASSPLVLRWGFKGDNIIVHIDASNEDFEAKWNGRVYLLDC